MSTAIRCVVVEFEDGQRFELNFAQWLDLQKNVLDRMIIERASVLVRAVTEADLQQLLRERGEELGLVGPTVQ